MKQRNRLAAAALAAILALSLAACSSSSSATASSSAASYMAAPAAGQLNRMSAKEMDAVMEEAGIDPGTGGGEMATAADTAAPDGGTLGATVDPARKMIRRVYLEMETKQYDQLTAAIATQVTALGGYIENSEQQGGAVVYDDMGQPTPRGERYTYVVARVPQNQVDAFINGLGQYGSVQRRQESVEDVTLQYVDVESHKKSLLIEQERLMTLLEKAEKLEDIIALEARLSEVRYQLESYESQLRTFDNQINYSTVTITVSEVERITPQEEKTVWSRISAGFSNTLYSIGVGAQNLFVWLAVNLPYLVIWAIVLIVIYVLVRKWSKKHAPRLKKQAVQAITPGQNPPQENTPEQK